MGTRVATGDAHSAARLIGRAAQTAMLHAALADAAGGTPQLIELIGPPGIGATALAEALVTDAAAAAITTLVLRPDALTRDRPYAALVRTLAAAVRALPADDRLRSADAYAPLRGFVAGLHGPAPTPLADPALERARVHEAFARLVEAVLGGSPALLLLDDAPLLDDATLAVLDDAATALADHGGMLLVTEHAEAPPALATLLSTLRRDGWTAHRHVLPPLNDADADLLLTTCAGRPLASGARRRAVTACAGLPLLVAAVGRDLAARPAEDDALPLPADIRDRVRMRMHGLDEPSREIMTAVAVGGGLPVDVIAEVCACPPDEVAAPLAALQRAGLIRLDDGRWMPAHDLLRDAAIAALPEARTQAVHARLARALRATDAPGAATHAVAGIGFLDPDEAARIVLAEADRLDRLGAAAPALRLVEALSAHLGRMLPETRSRVLLLLGRCRRHAGDDDGARRALDDAADAFDAAGDPIGRAGVDREHAELEWAHGEFGAAQTRLQSARARLDGLEPSEALAGVLHAQAVHAMRRRDVNGLAELAGHLTRLSERLGTPDVAARIRLVEGAAHFARTDFVAAEQATEAALASASGSDDLLLRMRAHDQLAVVAAAQGDLDALRVHSLASARLGRGIPLLQGWPIGRLAIVDLARGNADAALRATARLVEDVVREGDPRARLGALSLHGLALVHAGRTAAARAAIDEARHIATDRLDGDKNVVATLELADLSVALAQGQPDAALARVTVIDDPAAGWLPLLSIAVLGRALAAVGDRPRIAALIDRVDAVVSCRTTLAHTVATWLRALHANTDAAASPLFSQAAAGFAELGLTTLVRRDTPPASVVAPALSARELDVARLVAAGLTNGQVADRLGISPRTVSTHLDHIYRRFGFRSRVGLTRYLVDAGFVDAGFVAAGFVAEGFVAAGTDT
ncbi:LuxR family transcriptional regulator [Microbacterium protaetiae]|uniref:LuxR family transcriptional regulator n=1 Tax=Microbacterium protaetiae TaxID=2509458 RepID=A0A4P6EE81_9MICO|nr:LuxR family transcriptional regulator [Microbacterium protaetiae]QAY60454.1 LuxR family transcriptional regulator [Microbacterium protaetiae]